MAGAIATNTNASAHRADSAGLSDHHCQANSLTDSYGLLVQLILAGLAFCSLIIKRACEPADIRRPWIVWFLDTSKQAVGASFIHCLNVFLAPLFAKDPCTWYVVSFLLDSTLGLLIIYIGIKVVTLVARCQHLPTLQFGEYGRPASCRSWLHQCIAFLMIAMVMKLAITVIQHFHFWQVVRKLILSPIKDPKIEVTLVMLVIPFIVNTFMFWAIDNFTMKKKMAGQKLTGDDLFLDDDAIVIRTHCDGGSSTGSLNRSKSGGFRSGDESCERLLGEEDDLLSGDLVICDENGVLKQRHNSNTLDDVS